MGMAACNLHDTEASSFLYNFKTKQKNLWLLVESHGTQLTFHPLPLFEQRTNKIC